jgi:hypothetical protein
MSVWMSRDEQGHSVVLRLAESVRVEAVFVDDGKVRDITAYVADLVLTGLAVRFEHEQHLRADAPESVPSGMITLVGDPSDFVALYLHAPTRVAAELGWEEAATLIALGAVEEITAGVASDVAAAELGDTPAEGVAPPPPTQPPAERLE